MAAIPVQVIYDPDGANTDITNSVIFRSVRLSSALAAQPGVWQATVKDPERTMSFTTGKRVIWKLQGNTFYAGFLTQVSDTFPFPAVRTDVISNVKERQFILRGVDYNILFDKRVLRDTDNYVAALTAPGAPDAGQFTRAYDGDLVQTVCAEFLDLPSWLDTSAEVENVAYIPRKSGAIGAWAQPGDPWRTQMDDLSKISGVVYYIRPFGNDARLVWKALEDTNAPYTLSDKPETGEHGFRELDYLEDASGMVNDALVWGGSEFTPTGAGVIFGRTQNTDSIDDHGRWQWAEVHGGDTLYASQEEVDNRADAIVLGRTGDTIHLQNRGLQRPNKSYSLAWHNRDIPIVDGDFQFIYPGDLTTLKLHVFGDGVDPLIEVLPCRQITATFPDNDASGDSYVRFEGTFSLQTNDRNTLWAAVARRRRHVISTL